MSNREESTATELSEYLRDVAEVLGPPWQILPPHSTGEVATLSGP
ncbi:hypothetical protein [Amycolatopsis sp. lyj-108]